jgi:hypothetical protein
LGIVEALHHIIRTEEEVGKAEVANLAKETGFVQVKFVFEPKNSKIIDFFCSRMLQQKLCMA